MELPSEPQAWQFSSAEFYVPITYEDEIVGFCKPDFAIRIVKALNDDEKLYKALWLACDDLMRRSGGKCGPVDELMGEYLAKTVMPQTGIAAIADLLRRRQAELDISDKEFFKFCDSYRLPPDKLQAIYDGEEIDSSILTPLARVLSCSVDDLLEVLEEGVI
ncbi:MAG TPA: hypothetical protein V6C78_13395 [Crinalium sp.]